MDTGIYLDQLLVINWSLHRLKLFKPFSKDGAILAGDNGCGKTTTLDALLTLLLGSTNRNNYNQAANASAAESRTFESYLIAKRDGNSKSGIRQGKTFTTHLAAVFYDSLSKSKFVFGIVIDYRGKEQNSMQPPRMYSYEGDLPEKCFTADNKALNWHDTQILLSSLNSSGEIENLKLYGSRREYRDSLLVRVGITDPSYLNSIRSLVSVNNKKNIEEFIYENLCSDLTPASADTMNEVIDNWQSCQDNLIAAKENLKRIYKEKDLYNDWKNSSSKKDSYHAASVLVEKVEKEKKISRLEREKERREKELSDTQVYEKNLQMQKEVHESKLKEIEEVISSNDKARKRSEIEGDNDHLYKESDELQEEITKQFNLLNKSYETLPLLEELIHEKEFDIDISKLQAKLDEVISEGQGIFQEKQHELGQIISFSDQIVDALKEFSTRYQLSVQNSVNEMSKWQKVKKQASQQNKAYENQDAKRVIKYLYEQVGCSAICLCDAIDVSQENEAWRGVIETILGKKRFNVLVSPNDYRRARRAFYAKPFESQIRLVNTLGLISEDIDRKDNSLAEKIIVRDSSVSEAAQVYLDYLLGKVICTDDIESFIDNNPRSQCVTVDGKRYSSFESYVLSIRKEDFVIGKKAQTIRQKALLEASINHIAQLEVEITENRAVINKIENISSNLLSSKSVFGLLLDSTIDKANKVQENDLKIQNNLEMLEMIEIEDQDGQIKELLRQRSEISNNLKEINRLSKETNVKIGGIKEGLKNLKSNLQIHNSKLEELAMKERNLGAYDKQEVNTIINEKNAKEILSKLQYFERKAQDNWQKVYLFRSQNKDILKESYDLESKDNLEWEKEATRLEQNKIPEFEELFSQMEEDARVGFTTSIVGTLSAGLRDIDDVVRSANRILRNVSFDGESNNSYHYEFVKTVRRENEKFYRMITDKELENAMGALWNDAFYEKHGDVVEEFFETIRESRHGDTETKKAEAKIRKEQLLDYRSYYDFDMIELYEDGSKTSLKEGIGSGSTGEQLLPFYIVLLTAIAKKAKTDKHGQESNTLRTVLIDEAFDKVDESRTEKVMNLIKEMRLQPILAAPGVSRINFFGRLTGSGFVHRKFKDRFEVTTWTDPTKSESEPIES